jgi:hypothetical protein
MASFFERNFDYTTFKAAIIETSQYRNEHYLRLKLKGTQQVISTGDISSFLDQLDGIERIGFAKAAFAKSKTKTGSGNIFGIRLADHFRKVILKILSIIAGTSFYGLYPSKPVFTRNAALNRSLQKIEAKCEITRIQDLPGRILKTSLCRANRGSPCEAIQNRWFGSAPERYLVMP